jgi:hypothetical protein
MFRSKCYKDQPVFVRFQGDRFSVGKRRREQLQGVITDMIPMRMSRAEQNEWFEAGENYRDAAA